jgi:hypothetical protein
MKFERIAAGDAAAAIVLEDGFICHRAGLAQAHKWVNV